MSAVNEVPACLMAACHRTEAIAADLGALLERIKSIEEEHPSKAWAFNALFECRKTLRDTAQRLRDAVEGEGAIGARARLVEALLDYEDYISEEARLLLYRAMAMGEADDANER